MHNYCSHIPMPPANPYWELRPYDIPIRSDSIIDLNYRRSRQEKINAILGLARCAYLLGQKYKLNFKHSFAAAVLRDYGLPFEIVGTPKLLESEK